MNQNIEPQDTNNNIFEQNEGQPFARRTVSWAFNLGLVILVMGIFAGWYFSASDEPDGAADTQMPGNQYPEDSVRGGVYDFFYGIFSGFDDDGGAPLETPAVSDVPTMPLKDPSGGMDGTEDVPTRGSDAIVVPSADEEVLAAGDKVIEAENITPETVPSYFDGKILDYEGNVAGDVKAMIRNEDGKRFVFFELDQSLTPADKPRDYSIAHDKVEIYEEEGARFIKLNKEQTEALAKTLYKSDDDASPSRKPSAESE